MKYPSPSKKAIALKVGMVFLIFHRGKEYAVKKDSFDTQLTIHIYAYIMKCKVGS